MEEEGEIHGIHLLEGVVWEDLRLAHWIQGDNQSDVKVSPELQIIQVCCWVLVLWVEAAFRDILSVETMYMHIFRVVQLVVWLQKVKTLIEEVPVVGEL